MRRVVVIATAVLGIAWGGLTAPTQAMAATAWETDQLVVDQVAVSAQNDRVLVVGDGDLVQFDASTGAKVHTTAIGAGEAAVTVSTDGDTAYVSTTTSHTLRVIDVASGSVTRTYTLPGFDCARNLTLSSGRLYFTRCNNGTSFMSWIDLAEAGDVIHDGPSAGIDDRNIRKIVASEDGSRLFIQRASDEIEVWSSGASGLKKLASRYDLMFSSMSLDTDGEHLILATSDAVRYVRRTDLVTVSTGHPSATYGDILSGVSGGFFIDLGRCDGYPVWDRSGVTRRWIPFAQDCNHAPPAWLGSALVYAELNSDGTHHIVRDDRAISARTRLVAENRHNLTPGAGDSVRGLVDPFDPVVGAIALPSSDGQVQVSRTFKGVTTDLPPVTTRADGTFAVRDDAAALPGDTVSYTFTFDGDATHDPAGPVTKEYTYGGVPWDFNSDGYADLAVGAPLENVGSISDAGSVTVIPGGPSGASGTGAVTWTQDSAGVVGASEAGDQFGYALTSADYDGDGYADLAIGANAEDVGTTKNVGAVTVLRGSAAGLTGTGSYSPTTSVTSRTNLYAGEALASLDYNADGYADLGVGLAGNDTVAVYKGSAAGATKLGTAFNEDTTGLPGTRHSGESFGGSLAAGDFDGDGRDDLAVGIRYDYDEHGFSTGAVVVLPGTGTAFDFVRGKRLTPDTTGVLGVSHKFGANDASDEFGGILAAGDVNGDGIDDLAVSAAGAPVVSSDGVKHEDAGEVHVFLGAPTGITTTGNRLINQETAGVPGTSEKGDQFGRSLDIGLDRSGAAETLVVGNAGDQSVTLFPAGDVPGSKSITQDSTGVPDATEAGDDFSAFAHFLNLHGAGPADLAISADGEDSYAGAVWTIPSTSTGVSPGSGSVMLTENSAGIPGSAEAGDRWGWLGDSH